MAPSPLSDTLVCKTKGREKSEEYKFDQWQSAAFTWIKAICQGSIHWIGFGPTCFVRSEVADGIHIIRHKPRIILLLYKDVLHL